MKINIKKFKTVKSTNDIAIKLIQKNYSEPTLITCENKQKEGEEWEKNGFQKKVIYFSQFFFKLEKKILILNNFQFLMRC